MIHGVLLIIFIPILLRKRKGALNIQLIIFRFETTTDFVGFKNYISYAVMQNKNFSFLLRTAKEFGCLTTDIPKFACTTQHFCCYFCTQFSSNVLTNPCMISVYNLRSNEK